MTIYETIKAVVSVKQAAEHYGLKVSRNGDLQAQTPPYPTVSEGRNAVLSAS